MSSNIRQDRICVQKISQTPQTEMRLKEIQDAKTPQEYEELSAAFFSEKLWEIDATIKIKFLKANPFVPRTPKRDMNTKNGPIDPLQQFFFDNPTFDLNDAVVKIVRERIEPLVKLNFVFLDDNASNEESDVRIDWNENGGCWSYLGTDAMDHGKDEATMSFAWFDVSTVMHEFGHMLGMIHEHQNPSGTGIDWNEDAVYEWAADTQGWDMEQTKKNILDKYNREDINGSEFDPLSIMLYFFPASLTNNNKGTYQNLRLSGTDMKYIAKNYSDEGRASIVFKDIYGQDILENIQKSIKMRLAKGTMTRNIIIALGVVIIIIVLIWLFRKN